VPVQRAFILVSIAPPWLLRQLFMAGQIIPRSLLASDEALVEKVESTPGTVGLVDVYSITGGVNVLRASGKLPLEPGYPLHGN